MKNEIGRLAMPFIHTDKTTDEKFEVTPILRFQKNLEGLLILQQLHFRIDKYGTHEGTIWRDVPTVKEERTVNHV